MKTAAPRTPRATPVDDEHARMMAYARSAEVSAKIAKAQAEIDAGKGVVADHTYFENLKARRSLRRDANSPEDA